MIESFGVARNKIRVNIKSSPDEWTGTAYILPRKEMCGFIRFLSKQGTVELTNFKTFLPRKTLDMGVTTKANVANLAGTHGEGFKVASLVMLRKGLQVRYQSGKFYWSFTFGGKDRRHLYCSLFPMAETKLAGQIAADKERIANDLPRTAETHIWEDVSVMIGNVHRSGATKSRGKKIDFETFKTWIQIALPLQRPKSIVKTKFGDLILDNKFAGRIYLKGLYVGGSASSQTTKYGYNFVEGDICRDRKKLANSEEEAKAIAAIWSEAVQKEPDTIGRAYAELLVDQNQQGLADISHAGNYMTSKVAALVWNQIRSSSGYPKNVFYYNSDSTNPGKVCFP